MIATATPAGGVAGFGDVDAGRFYTEAVQWMVDEDITTGTSPTCFSPDDPVTRGQAAAFLWRMEGFPAGAPPHPFIDVLAVWQQEPVSWMADEGITTGTSPTTYSPDDTLTRGQMAALIHRAAGEPAGAPPHPFTDVVAPWQQAPVSWMADEGITTGTSPTTFSPDDPVTRGQFAAFSYRWKGEPAVVLDIATPLCGLEEFDGGIATDGWIWSSTGTISFTAMPGYVTFADTPELTFQGLARSHAADRFEIETKVSFTPVADFQAAGLFVTILEEPFDEVDLTRQFCDPSFIDCVGDGIYLDYFSGDDLVDTRVLALPAGTGDVYLRLRREGGTYTGWYSLDGANWTLVGSVDAVLVDPSYGIGTYGSESGPGPTAHFDFFIERAI